MLDPLGYGAVADGATDDSAALNRTFAAAARTGVPVNLGPRSYAIGAPLDGSLNNIRLIGVPGVTTFKKLDLSGTYGIVFSTSVPSYSGWSFEGITFNGNAPLVNANFQNLFLSSTYNVEFRRCVFRNLHKPVWIQGTTNVRFVDCDFYGVVQGVMADGVQDPAPNSNAVYRDGLLLSAGCSDILVEKCRFNFCLSGISAAETSQDSCRNLSIVNCKFRGDWWNQPYKIARLTVGSYDPTMRRLTVAAGGLTPLFQDSTQPKALSFRVPIATGTGFASIVSNNVTVSGAGLAGVQVGDVIETVDGRRGEVMTVVSASQVAVLRWESMSMYEPVGPPSLSTAFRVSRYYTAMSYQLISDTVVQLYLEPTNQVNSEQMITDARIDPTGLSVNVASFANYGGLHAQYFANILVSGCHFRGVRSDQCSVFYSEGLKVIGNHFELTAEECVTSTSCLSPTITGNTFVNCGASAIFLGDSHYATCTGNTTRNWATVNRFVLGAIEGSGKYMSITGNSFFADTALARGGASPYAVAFYSADSSGTLVSDNTGTPKIAMLYADQSAAPNSGAIVARGVGTVQGAGAANVSVYP